eukprot:11473512-Prorocentrum_lima.AAC.1
MRELMPTSDLSRMSMARKLQMQVSRCPATLSQLEHAGLGIGTWCLTRTKKSPHRGQGHHGDRCINI